MAKIMALKINNDTYPVYLASGAPVHPLVDVNDQFIVKSDEFLSGWGFFTERDFRENYKFLQDPPLPQTKFTPVVKAEGFDE